MSWLDLSADSGCKSLKEHRILPTLLPWWRTKNHLLYSKRYESSHPSLLSGSEAFVYNQSAPSRKLQSRRTIHWFWRKTCCFYPRGRRTNRLSIHHWDYGFAQAPGGIQAAGVNSTCRPAEFSVDAIDPTDLAGTKLDSIDTGYRQTLSAFNTFVCGIANVCPLNRRCQVLTDNT